MKNNSSPSATLLICEAPDKLCQFGSCTKPADLFIMFSDAAAASVNLADAANAAITLDAEGATDSIERFWCVDHWAAMRRLFVQARSPIHYGEGVPELIVERLSVRVGTGSGVKS